MQMQFVGMATLLFLGNFFFFRFLSSKQKKVPLIPEGFNGNKVDEWLEYAVTKELDFDFIEKSLSGKFLVGVRIFIQKKKIFI